MLLLFVPVGTRKKEQHTMARGEGKKSFEYEFMGPVLGPIGVMFGLPLICYGLVYTCNAAGCFGLHTPAIPGWAQGTPVVTLEGIAAFAGWFLFVVLLHLTLPGAWHTGTTLPNGGLLEYKLNGLACLLITLAVCAANAFVKESPALGWVYDNYLSLLSGSVLFSVALSLYLYVSSFAQGRLLAAGGTSGNAVYDLFMGRELNPRIGQLDLKEFCELYPGLIGWAVINLAMAYKQHEMWGHVSASMVLVCLFQLLYVVDALWFEKSILTTMDITTEGFGFMLAFGDLTWVPFTYSLQARYLVDHPTALSWPAVVGILALHTLGYAIFRGANRQKDIFRQDPTDPRVQHLKTLKTERGRLLMVSGWWGISRHINYFGDWVMGLSWCLPCGFDHIVPYFYAIYFACLLIHREMRDEHACRLKYGRDWDKYCSLVRWRIIPYVY